MRIMKTRIRHLGIAAALCAVCAAFCACGQNGKGGDRVKEEAPVREKGEILAEIHVSSAGDDKTGDGTKEHPFATIEEALIHTGPGSEVAVHEGEYPAFEIGASESGTADKPVIIRADEDGKVCDTIVFYVNHKFEDGVGKKASELLGRRTRELFPSLGEDWYEKVGRAALRGETVIGTLYFAPNGKTYYMTANQVIHPGYFSVTYQEVDLLERLGEK